jgi:hypothetical protein
VCRRGGKDNRGIIIYTFFFIFFYINSEQALLENEQPGIRKQATSTTGK